LTRGWLWLLNNQNIAVSFASLTGSIAAIPGTYMLGTAVCSPAAGLLAAAAPAIDYDAVRWAPHGWRDDTFTATFVFAVWALVRMRQKPAAWRGMLAGALGALACLTRLSALSFLIPCLIWVELTVQDTWNRGLRVVAVAAGVCLLLVAPYVINC